MAEIENLNSSEESSESEAEIPRAKDRNPWNYDDF